MEYRPLADFVELSQGLAVNKGTAHLFSDIKNCEFPYPLLRIVDFEAGIHDNYTKYVSKDISPSVIIDEDTIVFTRVTCQCFKGFKGVLHNNLFVVNLISDEITKDYLFTVLQSEFVRKQALYFAQSSVVPDLNHKMFKEIRIPVPNKSTQERISELYLNITNKIDNNVKINNELEIMSRTIYDYWFLQFDFPDENGKPYKSSGGKMVWNEELKREIPEGWKRKIIGEIVSFENGDRGKNYPSGEDFKREGIPFINGSMINSNRILYNELQYINEEKYNQLRAGKAGKGDILLTLRGSLAKCSYNPFERAAIASALVIARPKKEINNTFLYYLLNSDYLKRLYKNYDNGSIQANLSVDTLKSFDCIVPTTEVLILWNEIIGEIDKKISYLQQENQELVSLRDFLLPLLMNGQVGFRES